MKLSLVFELLLIFILLAFAASKSVGKNKHIAKKGIQNRNDEVKPEDNTINKYCKCVESYCNCCREFKLPVVELNGPGCASLRYLNGDKMSVSLSFGKKVIANRTLSSRKPSPVCMPLPGGVSKFCGRVYNIARAGEEFRACLGLELQSKSTVEAAVRVSCFKFGPRGVTSEPADPLPLVPQDEKGDDDDDDYDDDDDDDFGLGDEDEDDDDDDDDDDGTLGTVNDVDTADYTGFSLLGEDLLGDLFGSSGDKKPNKNRKKQAPLSSSSTTTTTRRPRPTRRPVRRPSTRTTTSRPTRSTTVRIRPGPGNRRPTRKPTRRPTRRPSTTESTSTSIMSTSTSIMSTSTSVMPSSTTTVKPATVELSSVKPTIETMVQEQPENTATEKVFDELPVTAQKPMEAATTVKTVSQFEDPGLEMSLAHITGQLSVMSVTPMITSEPNDSTMMNKKDPANYEKVETITPKAPSTIPFATSEENESTVNDDMIQIVQNLDSHSAETIPERENISAEESRSHIFNFNSPDSNNYEGLSLVKKNRNNQFDFEDLDVLDLTQIGESLGTELGIFGRNKRQNKNKYPKIKNDDDKGGDEYDDLMVTVGEGLMMMRKSDKNNNKRDRRRQNKMMRGEW